MAKCNTSTQQGSSSKDFILKNKKGRGETKSPRIKRRNPEAKMAFPADRPWEEWRLLTERRAPSVRPGPPPSRALRLWSRPAACAGGCAAAAAGRGGWRAGPPGSSRRTGSGCRRRRHPASWSDWPGTPPAGCLCHVETKPTGRVRGQWGETAQDAGCSAQWGPSPAEVLPVWLLTLLLVNWESIRPKVGCL